MAQEVGEQPDAAAVAPPPIWVVPRISLSQTISNNGNLAAQNRQQELITDISPGIGIVANTARLKGFFDYSLRAVYDSKDTVREDIQQSLVANGTFEAWDNRAFIDFAGLIGQQAISAFAAPSTGSLGNGNLSETKNFRVSPYLRGTFANSVNYELRYSWETTKTDTTLRSDNTIQELRARLARDVAATQTFGWSLEAGRTNLDYSMGDERTLEEVNGRLFYAVSPTLIVSALAGVESNNLLTPEMKSYSAHGVGLDWRPSDRTRVVLERSNRYFGNGHNVEVEYRSRRSVWRYVDTRDVVTNDFAGGVASRGTLYDLIDSRSTETDPVRRAQQVDAELQRLGLPANFEVVPGYLTSSASVQRMQELSLGLFGQRNAFVLAVVRNSGRRLSPFISLVDDFSLAPDIRESGWRATYAHRLTPLTAVTASYSRLSNEGINTQFRSNLKTLLLGVSTRLALRTNGAVQLRYSVFNGINPYKETAVLGVITHRF